VNWIEAEIQLNKEIEKELKNRFAKRNEIEKQIRNKRLNEWRVSKNFLKSNFKNLEKIIAIQLI
jgi:hypothetical protein